MSWEIVLFNSSEKIESPQTLDENKLIPADFCLVLEKHFPDIIKDGNHHEIRGENFSIDYFMDKEPVSNKLLSLYGEPAIFEMIRLAKEKSWQIFDMGLGAMIDLDNPSKNGYKNFQAYLKHVLKK